MVNLATLALPPFLTTFCRIKEPCQEEFLLFDTFPYHWSKIESKTTTKRERREERKVKQCHK